MTITDFLEARIAEDEYAANRELLLGTTTVLTRMNARVLAECAAKRAIIQQHPRDDDGFCYDSTTHQRGCKWAHPCPTLRALAAVYSSHGDYDSGWAL